ncbi:DNA repair protein XRCC1-like [Mytilus californianus]|uniref:DNA repair protein XRCC1-like n=1 Tax=Mytilus californianus TaxID=6549 RepID=UPI002246FF6F|nr:DNA repair protein XRCC1-like [Mytilus californianus]
MPEIKVKHIVSCSCADKNNPAENLLKAEGSHKWKTTGQPKNAVVVLQLEKSSQVNSIDVGNEGSAFVEILVGKETATTDHDYKVILVASSFMTPLESRNGTNRNSVRMFGPEKLSNAVASEKWDRLKIVCTQPFNKTSEYGLSFIKIHSTPDDKEEGTKKLGAFTVKPETGDDITTGSLFAKKKIEPVEKPSPTGAAAVRAASRLADESMSSPKIEKQVTPTAQNKRKHTADSDDEPSGSGTPVPSLKKQSTSLSSTASSAKSESVPPLKKTKSEPPKESAVKAFGRLMEGVVFAMSGFQNPYRAELRQKAVDMGAVYKPDWGKGCTHLICAFSKTPKYNQVRGKGKIVKKDWILQSYKQKKLIPWRHYRLGDADSPDESSTDEDVYVPKKSPPKKKPSETKSPKKTSHKPSKEAMDMSDSGDDTEDEVRRVKAKIDNPKGSLKKDDDDNDPYNASTDEDAPSSSKKESPIKNGAVDDGNDSGFPELPDFFRKKHFLLYGDYNERTRRSMVRYITAYDGELEDYMSDKVNFVVTNSEWDQNFDDALTDNPSLIFVKPIWVAKCHDKSKFVPYQPYVIIPVDDDD